MTLYRHVPHAHIAARKAAGPVKVDDQRARHSWFARFNTRVGLRITLLVGTMACGYVFAIIALLSLPSAISTHNLTVIIAWVSSNFLQLVLLPIIIVGQNVQATAADKRAESTYLDAEAILQAASQIAEHLGVQDAHLLTQDDRLAALADQLTALVIRLSPPLNTAAADGGAS